MVSSLMLKLWNATKCTGKFGDLFSHVSWIVLCGNSIHRRPFGLWEKNYASGGNMMRTVFCIESMWGPVANHMQCTLHWAGDRCVSCSSHSANAISPWGKKWPDSGGQTYYNIYLKKKKCEICRLDTVPFPNYKSSSEKVLTAPL